MSPLALASSQRADTDAFASRLIALLSAPACAPTACPPAPVANDPGTGEPATPTNYVIPANLTLGLGGPKAKFAANVAAIRVLREVEAAKRPATADEQQILVQYVGWGGLPQAFRRPDGGVASGWENEVQTLEALLTVDELESVRRSTTDAHYTPRVVIDAIYAGLRRMGFAGGRVLEPAAGIGHFLGMAPADLRNELRWTTVELDALSAGITEALYPRAQHVLAGC